MARLQLELALYSAVTQLRTRRKVPLIDVGTIDLIRRRQIEIFRGIARLSKNGVVFVDGREYSFAAAVLATGYRPGFPALFETQNGFEGLPEFAVNSPLEVQPGLFFCGFVVTGGGTFRLIATEAEASAGKITARTKGKELKSYLLEPGTILEG